MTQPVSGIAGSQGASRAAATTSRNSSRGKLKKFGPYLAILMVVLALLTWWKNTPNKESIFSSTSQSTTPTSSAVWKQTAEDGSIPPGVWSESTMLPPGSKTFFDAGNGTVYQIRYRLYKGEWTTHPGTGNFPPADEIQFKALKEGLTKIPFTVKRP